MHDSTELLNWKGYFLMTIIVGLTALPHFYIASARYLFFVFGLVYFRKMHLSRVFIVLIITLVGTMVIQAFFYGGDVTIFQFANQVAMFTVPYFIIRRFDYQIDRYFVNVLYVWTLVSLVIYLFSLLNPIILDFIRTNGIELYEEQRRSIIVYSHFFPSSLYTYQIIARLQGPFTEPGAYALYLLLAMMLNWFRYNSIFNVQNLIFTIALLLTQSTAGYIAFALLLVISATATKKFTSSALIILAVLIMATAFMNAPFIRDKIQNEIATANAAYDFDDRGSRIHDATKSLSIFRRYWLFGRGINAKTYETASTTEVGGFSVLDIWAKMGITIFAIYMSGLYGYIIFFIKKYKGKVNMAAKLALVLPLSLAMSSQPVHMYSFLTLMFIYTGMDFMWKRKAKLYT
ncbi:MAG: hypothetical protein CVU48_02605 [Candidatus Cloacimonetes bacterium HGW-Cloacimonetes-1]|jgi:hypothetical protein|nr:MAG: hypothetical protein CVU48_02605 [Candidatus Cloacimonetes bacterium HGW-Cloacimonetes-1]